MSVVLDISRYVSRVGLGFNTGIDRVERAFILDTLVRFNSPSFFAKTGKTAFLLDKDGMARILELDGTNDWPIPFGLDHFRYKLTYLQRQVRTAIRDLAKSRSKFANASSLFVHGSTYLNVGHSNLSELFLHDLKVKSGVNIVSMIHDMIPLDFPEYCRPDRIENFKKKASAISKYSNLVLCNSEYTKSRVLAHFKTFGRVPDTCVALLGLDIKQKNGVEPFDINGRLNFLSLGTIEPRKNTTLLLNVWEQLSKKLPSDKMPNLLLVGRRGWESQEFFERLDKHPLREGSIFEFNNFDDKQVLSAIRGSRALLFPSFVEGYGLPMQEARANGVDVICSDIPVFRELLGPKANLVSPQDSAKWEHEVTLHLRDEQKCIDNNLRESDRVEIPNWKTFFKRVYESDQLKGLK